jgi:hypothetical protein
MLLKCACAALAAVAATVSLPDASEAKTRLNLHFFPEYDPEPLYYYPGPQVAPRPRYYYYYDDEDDFAYEPDYYEPEYEAPPRKKRLRTVRRQVEEPVQKRKKLAVKKPVEAAAPRKPKTRTAAKKPAVDNVNTASIDKAPEKTAAKPGGKLIACSKASSIVSDYGFTDVKSTDCQGQAYAFTAKRDGKPYVIKLSAVSGELTEVAKQ